MKILILFVILSNIYSQQYDFYHNGENRQYFLYEPETIQENAPLVFALHGYGGGPNWMINNTGLNEIADLYGFAVCYPKGTTDNSNNRFWNVGYEFHQGVEVDDVDFISALALFLQSEYGYNNKQTFATGMSNGADMSYMLGCQTNDIFKAIAPVAGCMMEEIYNTCNSIPLPIFEIHGTNDNITLWDGDMENNDGWGAYLSTSATIDFWVEKNGCESSEKFIDPNINLTHHRNFDCLDNTEVWLYEIAGGGHDWPIYSSEAIWGFFSKFNYIIGDFNFDDDINILDVIILVNHILSPAAVELEGADINNDGDVNILDIIQLLNIILS